MKKYKCGRQYTFKVYEILNIMIIFIRTIWLKLFIFIVILSIFFQVKHDYEMILGEGGGGVGFMSSYVKGFTNKRIIFEFV